MAKTKLTYLVQDALITDGECQLHSITLVAAGTGNATCVLYEGLDAGAGRELCQMATTQNTTLQLRFEEVGIIDGLYCDVGDNVSSVTVEWA